MFELKAMLISLGLGIMVGAIYSLSGVRSPAPPVIALVGLLGILLGEQITPEIKGALVKTEQTDFSLNQKKESK